MFTRAALSILLCLVAQAASAIAVVDTNVSAPDGKDVHADGPVTAQSTVTYQNGSASAFADLNLGVLKASAIGSGDPSQRLGTYASTASPSFQDMITFSPGASGTAYLEYHFDGNLDAPSAHTGADAYLGVTVGDVALRQIYLFDFPGISSPCAPSTATYECTAGSSIDETGVLAFQIGADPINISAFLQVVAENGATANFSDTAGFYLMTPPGVSYTSGSGTFLSAAGPIITSPVPEPATYLLFLVGLGLVGGATRTNRSTDRYNVSMFA